MRETKKLLERGLHTWSEDSVRLILSPSKTAKTIYLYAQECGYFKTYYPYFSERENLDSFLIIYTVSGAGVLEYEGNLHTLTEKQCFLIDCSRRHLYRTAKDESWEIVWLHFNGGSALGYYKELVRNGFNIVTCRERSCIKNNLEEIIKLQKSKDLTTEALTSNLIHNILTELLVQTATSCVDSFVIPDYIRQIAREIERNFRIQLSLAYFEESAHRSRYHILKEFKKYMGVTIHEYLILTRIAYAKELLKYTSLPVGDIAFEVGMNNVTHFINLFKNREDMTPLKYRKVWRENGP